MTLAEFLHMGGYGAFVWPAYTVTLVVLIINVYLARGSHRRAVSDALRRAAREEVKS
jgi:heme exporter protein D